MPPPSQYSSSSSSIESISIGGGAVDSKVLENGLGSLDLFDHAGPRLRKARKAKSEGKQQNSIAQKQISPS